ncbi:flagellin N-terminal helical domain-containing protein [Brevirhabdus sp.]|uniref:flagellin N-terminal helical domain-containing protein n=1 Tax=Brevirhabdus sp. TaxID=2004514 RepID=UPI0040597B23
MSSINTNSGAMSALSTLRQINNDLSGTQERISSGLKIRSSMDNAAYFSISETLQGDSGIYKAIDESMTLSKNSISAARLGSETVVDLAKQFVERVAFAQGGTAQVRSDVQAELDELSARIQTTIDQSTFNGSDLVNGAATVTVVTGINRGASGSFTTTTVSFNQQNLGAIQSALDAIDITTNATGVTTETTLSNALKTAESNLSSAISAATSFGIAEKSVDMQKQFLSELTDRIDSGVGSMIDANMEEEAAKLQALQVQQQLATQSLSIANQAPQNILSLFR